MKLKTAVKQYLKTKSSLRSYSTYASSAKYLTLDYELDDIDLVGDLKTSERKNRIAKTRRLFTKILMNLDGKSQNTKFFTVTMLKSVLKFVECETGSSFWAYYPISQEKKDIIILSPEFAKKFINDTHGVYEGLDSKLKAVHELSSVMLTTALRFIDAVNIKKENFKDGRITIKNKKTKVVTSCPIPSVLSDKLEQNLKKGSVYSAKLTKDECYNLFPVLFEKYDEMKEEIDGVPMYKKVKYHVFRKSAISLMLASGVPQSIVMAASGHSYGSRAFGRYVANVDKMFSNEINNFNDKFYGTV